MSETEYLETRLFTYAMEGDVEAADVLISQMTEQEKRDVMTYARRLLWWVDD